MYLQLQPISTQASPIGLCHSTWWAKDKKLHPQLWVCGHRVCGDHSPGRNKLCAYYKCKRNPSHLANTSKHQGVEFCLPLFLSTLETESCLFLHCRSTLASYFPFGIYKLYLLLVWCHNYFYTASLQQTLRFLKTVSVFFILISLDICKLEWKNAIYNSDEETIPKYVHKSWQVRNEKWWGAKETGGWEWGKWA